MTGGGDIPVGFEIFSIIMLGLLYGSFATALIWRVPLGVSWVFNGRGKAARSACPQCDHVLGLRDLIPIFSWVFMGGRCRHCRAPIGLIYPLVELTSVLLCLCVYAVWGIGVVGMVVMATVPFLLAMFVIDWRHFILPNQLNVILCVLGVVYQFLMGGFLGAAGAVVAGAGWGFVAFLFGRLMTHFLKKDALGLGDVKFLAVCGVWLPLSAAPGFLMVAGVVGVLAGLAWRAAGRGDVFPFGPALIVAFAVMMGVDGLGYIIHP